MWKVRPHFFRGSSGLVEKKIGLSIDEGAPICFKALLAQTSKAKHVSHWTFTWIWRSHVFQQEMLSNFQKSHPLLHLKKPQLPDQWFSKFSWHFSIFVWGWLVFLVQTKKDDNYIPQVPLNPLTLHWRLPGWRFLRLLGLGPEAQTKHHMKQLRTYSRQIVEQLATSLDQPAGVDCFFFFFCVCVFFWLFLMTCGFVFFLVWFCLVRMICLFVFLNHNFNFVGYK